MTTSQRQRVIVVGYDGSPLSQAAVRLAVRHAGRRGRLTVVHAYGARTGGLVGQAGGQHETADHGRALLEAIPLTCDDLLDVNYDTALVEGPAAAALAEVAKAEDADEIVVGARGLGLVRSLLGSVSRQLLQIADRPVVIIPAAGADDQMVDSTAAR